MCSVAWSLSDCPCCPTSQVQIKKAWSLRISGREVAAPLWVQVFSIKTNLLLCHGEKEASVKRETRRVGSPFLPVATVVCGFKEARSVSEEGSLSVCLPQLCPSLLPSLSNSPPLAFFMGFIHFLQFFVCLFLDFFKECINFLFKDLYFLHKLGFKFLSLCFKCIGIFRACYSRLPGLWWGDTEMAVVDCVIYTGL